MSDQEVMTRQKLEHEEVEICQQFKILRHQVALITALGAIVESFAKKHLKYEISMDCKNMVHLRKALTNFFKAPPQDLKNISLPMKVKILSIPNISGIDNVVERLVCMYTWFCHFSSSSEVDNLIKKKDTGALQLYLEKAPKLEKNDLKLYSIFKNHL